jgi:hypothetical protein
MDFWGVLLIFICLGGLGLGSSGILMSLFTQSVYLFCDWREGADVNWGSEVFWFVMPTFAWMFAIMELFVLYSR